MLASIQRLQRMSIQESGQVLRRLEHMLPGCQHPAALGKHTCDLTAQSAKVVGVVKHLPAQHKLEASFFKRERFSPGAGHLDRQSRLRSEGIDRSGAHQPAEIRFQRSDLPAIARKCVRGNAPSRAHVQGPPTRTKPDDLSHGQPFARPPIPFARFRQRIIEEEVANELLSARLFPDVADCFLPRHRVVLRHALGLHSFATRTPKV